MRWTLGWLKHRLLALGLRPARGWLARRCQRVQGLMLVPSAPNSEVQLQRLADALDLIALHSPRHLVWLRRSATTLVIWHSSQRNVLEPNLVGGVVLCNPQWIWRSSPADVALELVFVATLARVAQRSWRGNQLHWIHNDRLQDLAFAEKLRFAGLLPDGAGLIEKWRAWHRARSASQPADA